MYEQHFDQPLDRGFRSDLVPAELAHQQPQRRLQRRLGALVRGRDVQYRWEEREQRVRELVVVAEPGTQEAGGGTRPGDDEVACVGDELGLQVGVVSPRGDARRADEAMAETCR